MHFFSTLPFIPPTHAHTRTRAHTHTHTHAHTPFKRGFTSDQGYLCWNVSFNDFFGLVEAKAFQVAMALTNQIHKKMETFGFGVKDTLDMATKEKLEESKFSNARAKIVYIF